MKLYSFSGAVNPFFVRQRLYQDIKKLQDNIEGEVKDEHLDVLAFSLYHEYFGLGKASNKDIVELFKDVNNAIKTNFTCMSELISLAICTPEYCKDRNFEIELNEPKLRLCLVDRNIQVLADLHKVFPNNAVVEDCYLIANNLRNYVDTMGDLPTDMHYYMKNYAAAKPRLINKQEDGENDA